MTEAERIARGQRAGHAWDEFMAPMIGELKAAYSERMIEVANIDLSRDSRGDKLTALSNALKILATLEGGMIAMIRDGELAQKESLRADKIENMTAPKRRLLNIGGY